jgi:hypothetical protein
MKDLIIAFKHLVGSRRCIVPADGFYEWRKEGKRKVPMWVHLRNREPFGLAGLWDVWRKPDGPQESKARKGFEFFQRFPRRRAPEDCPISLRLSFLKIRAVPFSQNQCIIAATDSQPLSACLVLHFHSFSLAWVDLPIPRPGGRKTYRPLHNFEVFLLGSPSEP